MQTIQKGDCVRVHYRKHYQDGLSFSSQGKPPLTVTVGTPHPRLPGLNLELVGLVKGDLVTVAVPAQQPSQVEKVRQPRRVARSRFPVDRSIVVGKWTFVTDHRGRRRCVRVLGVQGENIVVDAPPAPTKQPMRMELRVVAIEQKAPLDPRD